MFTAENYQSQVLGKKQTLRGQILPRLSKQVHAYMIQECTLKCFFRIQTLIICVTFTEH